MSTVVTAGAGVTVEAIKFPPCECGVPYAAHRGGDRCQGYRPNGEVEMLGTRAYVPRPGLSVWRTVCCRLMWAVEFRLQGRREALERRKA